MPRNAAPGAPLDTRHPVETPEGIDLVLRPAGLLPRALAFAIDLAIRGAVMIVVSIALVFLGKIGLGLSAIFWFLLNWWYMVLFEVLNQGCTPGKKMLGLRVINDDGTPIGWTASLLRNLLRAVDMLPFGYAIGGVFCLQSSTFKRLGDLAAGTLVVYRHEPFSRPSLPDAVPVNAPFRLDLAEQRAILSFAERKAELSSERRDELAAIVAGNLNVAPAAAAGHLDGIARGLLGPT